MIRGLAIVEIVSAVTVVALAVLCWNTGVTDTVFAVAGNGGPEYVSTRYAGPWIALGAVGVVIAGLLLIDAVGRLLQPPAHTR
ncbi:hypothetical protein [Rhodococcus sp. H29-C3]|uniref:hypothetical protein n=1 Tax=Rhodococcus sp. H29-C3 TaxID=3046307 RepID=UPI0024BA4239|nr:hypothetical protein [Rhodococcus sp. H29-C3]MDJ0358929.1 hypothetical protein [Rhodococcus sp. H29-C3]